MNKILNKTSLEYFLSEFNKNNVNVNTLNINDVRIKNILTLYNKYSKELEILLSLIEDILDDVEIVTWSNNNKDLNKEDFKLKKERDIVYNMYYYKDDPFIIQCKNRDYMGYYLWKEYILSKNSFFDHYHQLIAFSYEKKYRNNFSDFIIRNFDWITKYNKIIFENLSIIVIFLYSIKYNRNNLIDYYLK